MIILGIESSCDETAAAVSKDGELLSNVVVSQIDIFKSYGGVIPEVAARSHLEAILPVIDKAFTDAKVTWGDIDAIAVTHTPGLLGSLLIGTLTARTLAILHNKPLYAVHHLKSHIYSNWLHASGEIVPSCRLSGAHERGQERATRNDGLARLESTNGLSTTSKPNDSNPEFPLLALVISGGHTQIIYMKEHNSFEIIGTTLDDAVGECFDKVAKILGLPYPGGPSVANAAKSGNPEKYKFPHPKIDGFDFSFSGLKTAVLRAVQKECGVGLDYPSHELKNLLSEKQVADFTASFQKTATDILLEKLNLARTEYPDVKSIVFAGGVSANEALRKQALEVCSTSNVYFPAPKFSGDNAAMVAMACYYEIKSGVQPTDPYKLDISPRSVLS